MIFERLVYLHYLDLTVTHRKNSLKYMGPKIWNSLPDDIKAADNIVIFKKSIRKFNFKGMTGE